MSDAVLKELENKAYFVSGRSARFRAASDPDARSAISDAKRLLNHFKDKVTEPMISAGTTSKPEKILTMTWLFAGYSSIRSIEISCKGHDHFDVQWDDPLGNQRSQSDITLTDLKLLNIPEKVSALESNAHPNGGNPPPNLSI